MKKSKNTNQLGEKITSFQSRRCSSFNELEEKYSFYKNRYGDLITEIHQGKNSETVSLLNESTKLVIIGSAIPIDLYFFYTGTNNHVYKWIDIVKNTNLYSCALRKDVNTIKANMADLKIAFFDLINWCFNAKGSSKDADILAYTIDIEIFDKLKQLKTKLKDRIKVVSVTKAVKKALDDLGIENEYCQLFPCARSNPSWNNIEDNWIPMLKRYL